MKIILKVVLILNFVSIAFAGGACSKSGTVEKFNPDEATSVAPVRRLFMPVTTVSDVDGTISTDRVSNNRSSDNRQPKWRELIDSDTEVEEEIDRVSRLSQLRKLIDSEGDEVPNPGLRRVAESYQNMNLRQLASPIITSRTSERASNASVFYLNRPKTPEEIVEVETRFVFDEKSGRLKAVVD